MIEITIGGLVGVIQKGGGVGIFREGDRVEGTPENEAYHVKNGHAVYVSGYTPDNPAGSFAGSPDREGEAEEIPAEETPRRRRGRKEE